MLPGDGAGWQQEEKALQQEKRAAREQERDTVTAALGSCDEVIPGKVIKSHIKKKIIQEVSDREMVQGDELNKKHAQHIKMNAVQIKLHNEDSFLMI